MSAPNSNGRQRYGDAKVLSTIERNAGLVRDVRHRLDVEHVDQRVAHGLGVHRLGLFRDRAPEILRLVGIDERGVDAELAEIHLEQGVGAAVQRRRRYDLVALLAQREQRRHFRRLAGGERQRRAPALERRHALFEHRRGRIRDARVDVAEGLQVEQARRVLRGVEHEGRGLVDRHRARTGGRVRNLSRVQAQRAESEFSVCHDLLCDLVGGASGRLPRSRRHHASLAVRTGGDAPCSPRGTSLLGRVYPRRTVLS